MLFESFYSYSTTMDFITTHGKYEGDGSLYIWILIGSIIMLFILVFVYIYFKLKSKISEIRFSSPEPKAQMNFSDRNVFVVRPCRHCRR